MSEAPVKIILSREAARYIRAGTPREAKLEAARGNLPLDLPEWVTVLFLLSQETDEEIYSTALQKLREIPFERIQKALEHGLAPPVLDLLARERRDDEALLLQIIDRPEVTDDTVAFLATLPNKEVIAAIARNGARVLQSPAILEALGTNPMSSRSMVDRLLFLFGVGKNPQPGGEEQAGAADTPLSPGGGHGEGAGDPAGGTLPEELTEEVAMAPNERNLDQHNLMSMVKSLTVFQKIKLALLGNKEARGILIRDRNKVVATAAMRNPKLTDTEVVAFSKSKEISEDVLRLIARSREWTKIYQVQLGLATNPKTPLIYSMKYVMYLKERDLRDLSRSKNVLPQINAQARRLLNRKNEVG